MDPHQVDNEARVFLEEYQRAFDSFDGNRIAELYHVPCVTMRGDGSIHCLQSRGELERFFQDVVDTYHSQGYRSGRFNDLVAVSIGTRSMFVTVEWELNREDGSVLRRWRQSYNLVRGDSGWRILVSTFHVA